MYTLKHPLYPKPELLALFVENNYPYSEKTLDKVYKRWYAKVKNKPQKLKNIVTQIYRVKVPNSTDEKVMYHETLIGEDHNGNEWTFDHLVGRWEKPIFSKQYDEETDDIISQEIRSHETVYDIEYTPAKIMELIALAPIDTLSLVIQNGAKKWSASYGVEEYANARFEDLEEKGRSGKVIEIEVSKQAKKQG